MSLPLLSFSSKALRPAVGFDAYHALYAAGADVARRDGAFHAEVRAHRFNRMLVFERRLAGVGHERNAARVRRDGFDHVTLHLLLSGTLIAGAEGEERRLRPGEILIIDTSAPQRNWCDDTHTITVAVARDQIGTPIQDPRAFHGTVLSQRAAGVIADLMISFTRRVDVLTPDTSDQLGPVLGMLLAAALKGTPPGAEAVAALGQPDGGRRRKVEAFIEAHLSDHGLDADAIAGGVGISRTVLYRCFAADGGVARFIQLRRLERIRNVLRRHGEAQPLAAIAHAHGFSSEQHLNRAFRSTFGRPPGQFRSMIEQLRRAKDPADGRTQPLNDWLIELY